MMLMEYCEKGELLEEIKKRDGIHDIDLLKKEFSQILNGVKAMHQLGFCHYDIKLDNVLIGNDGKLKICDMGFGASSDKIMIDPLGTACYMAPEIYDGQWKGQATDIFSLGVCLFAMHFAMLPWKDTKELQTGSLIQNNTFALFRLNRNFLFYGSPKTKQLYNQAQIDQNLMNLLFSMCEPDPAQRPSSIDSVLSHPFFT